MCIWILFFEQCLSWTWPICIGSSSLENIAVVKVGIETLSLLMTMPVGNCVGLQLWAKALRTDSTFQTCLCAWLYGKHHTLGFMKSLLVAQCIFSIMHGNDDDVLLKMCSSRFPISLFNYFFPKRSCVMLPRDISLVYLCVFQIRATVLTLHPKDIWQYLEIFSLLQFLGVVVNDSSN